MVTCSRGSPNIVTYISVCNDISHSCSPLYFPLFNYQTHHKRQIKVSVFFFCLFGRMYTFDDKFPLFGRKPRFLNKNYMIVKFLFLIFFFSFLSFVISMTNDITFDKGFILLSYQSMYTLCYGIGVNVSNFMSKIYICSIYRNLH